MRNIETKVLIIPAFILIAAIVIISFFSINNLSAEDISSADCEVLYNEIENDFKKANFCESSEDCKVISLGGWYIDFGCYKFINAVIYENELIEKIKKYKDEMKCSKIINECASSPIPVCINKKCIEKDKKE